MLHPDWKDPKGTLVGVDGNAFTVIGCTLNALHHAKNSERVRDAYLDAAWDCASYSALVHLSMEYIGETL